MQGVFDTYLTENKWLLNAEKAVTDEQRIKFCKAYLKHKGIDIDPMPMTYEPPKPTVQLTNKKTVKASASRIIDWHMWRDMSPTEKLQLEAQARVDIAKEIGVELAKANRMKFESLTKYSTAQIEVQGTIEVVE